MFDRKENELPPLKYKVEYKIMGVLVGAKI